MWATVGLDPIKHTQQDTSMVNGVVSRTVAFIEALLFMFRGPDLTHILTALSENQRKSIFPEFLLVPTSYYICIDFNLCIAFLKITSAPSAPRIPSKQKRKRVRKKIYSTASTGEKKCKAQLNWIELKCNQRTNTVYLMFSDNRLMLGIGGRSNTWKCMRLNFSLSLSQY